MSISDELEGTIDTVERLLPGIMRRVFLPPDADSPFWELPLPQLRLLGMLERRESARMSEVGECLGVALSTATQVADRLAARGWVERVPDPEDRRVVRLMLSEAGRRLVAERRAQRRQRLASALACLDSVARERVVDALEALHEAARRLDPAGCGKTHAPPRAGVAFWELMQPRGDVREVE
jgi:DNA-binding MarR family transcriptional regulator